MRERRGIIEPPRRSPWVVALDLYKAGGSFRGFVEFALIGAIVLAFLPGGGIGSFATSWMRGQQKSTEPEPVIAIAKPQLSLVPSIADVKIEPAYFDNVAEPLRTKLRNALSAYYRRDPRAVERALAGAGTGLDDSRVLLVLGLNLLSVQGTVTVNAGVAFLQRAAEMGEPRAMAVLGILKLSGLPGVGRDTAGGRELLRRAASAGDAAAARVMGEGFVTGSMGVVDPTRAEQYLRLASDWGDLRGTLRLGEMLMTGHGVPKDEREGERLIHKAAMGGHPEAQAMYGVLRLMPYMGGLTDNPDEALNWLERAAAQNEPRAMFYLGMFHIDFGKRIGRLDPRRGAELLQRCTETTMDIKCAFGYATALDLGIGVPRDAVKAYAIYTIAAATENAGKARARRDEVGKALTAQQIVQAHRITNELMVRSAPPRPPMPLLEEKFTRVPNPVK
jgi:TPR repeat protein